jgi:hypothetical protein
MSNCARLESTNQSSNTTMPTRVQSPEEAMNYAGKALMGPTPPVLSGGRRSRRSRRKQKKNRKSRRR